MLRLKSFGGLALERDGQVLTGAAARRRPVALLALLAAAGEHGLSRDKAVAYFWPEGDVERSRHALAQMLYSVRHDLGGDVLFATANDLRLNPALIEVDLWEFDKALAAGQRERAIGLYAGPFLDGFYINDAPEFERWAEDQRAQYAHRYRQVLEELAKQALASGESQAAVDWWRRLVNADPLDARAALSYMKGLAAIGDRAGALRHARVHEELVRQELKLPPDEAMRSYARQLRDEAERPSTLAVAAVPAATTARPLAPTVSPSPEDPGYRSTPVRMLTRSETQLVALPPPPIPSHAAAGTSERRQHDRRRSQLGVGLMAATLLAVVFLVRHRPSEARDPAVLAVGTIREYGGTDTSGIVRALGEMLTTNIARIPALRVISSARIYEFLGAAASGSSAAQRFENAARRAGASELVEGSLYLRPGKPMRLDIRRVDIASGTLRGGYTVEGKDLFSLVDSATAKLARDFDPHAAVLRIADVTTTSVIAHRFYDEGLRALYQYSDDIGALRLFQLALREDSSFAMAAFYVFKTGLPVGDSSVISAGLRSLRAADRVSDYERLLINAEMRSYFNDPLAVVYAESLTTRFPSESDGFRVLARAKIEGGDFLGAVPLLRRVIVMDSASLRRSAAVDGRRCEACEAYSALIEAYWRADSMTAMERVAREFLGRQPWSAVAIDRLGTVLEYEGRFDDAARELARASDSTHGALFDPMQRAELSMRAGRFAAADQLLEALVAGHDAPAPDRGGALWWLHIERRIEGRLRDAERCTRRIIALWPGNFEAYEAYGHVLFEEGRYREAAHVFDSLVAHPAYPSSLGPLVARERSWYLAHLATSVSALGDTARLARVADSLQLIGAQSAYGRDRLLHHYARGLLRRAEHNEEAAIEEFRRAIYSPTVGYTRVNLELGRLLLARGRPQEAVDIVRPALFGSLEASNGYVTRTALHELLGQAFDALHESDSATAHYRYVVDAWNRADAQFRARYLVASNRLKALASQGSQR